MSLNISYIIKFIETEKENSKLEESKIEESRIDKTNESEQESSDESIPDAGALDDDDDSDFDPNDDPEKLWCFCKKPHANRFILSFLNYNFF